MMKPIRWKNNMNKFKIGDKVIVSRYDKPRIKGTIESVPDGLIEIFYKVRLEDGNYLNSPEDDIVSAEIEKYFYCPVCGKKSLIKDAVIKRHILNKSFRLKPAAMPRWWKLSTSVEYRYIRVCPLCKDEKLPNNVYIRAYEGNAIENRKGKIRAAENSGCMVILASIAGIASLACWMICLML